MLVKLKEISKQPKKIPTENFKNQI